MGGQRPHQGGTPEARGVVKELLPANARVFGARIANLSDLDVLIDAARDEGRAQALAEDAHTAVCPSTPGAEDAHTAGRPRARRGQS